MPARPGFASSFSPNHSGWGGKPMPSTIATDEELKRLTGVLGESSAAFSSWPPARAPRRNSWSRLPPTPAGRRSWSRCSRCTTARIPERALQMYERCAQALARGREVYIHANCQPLSFDFTLREPYLLYSHDAFDAVKALAAEERGGIYQDAAFRERLRHNFKNPEEGILFYGDWSQVERTACRSRELAAREGKDPLDYVFDLPLDMQLVAKLFQNDDAGVAPLLKHPAGVIALSDAGAHLIYFCDAGFGLHFLAHWVREPARSRWRRACAA